MRCKMSFLLFLMLGISLGTFGQNVELNTALMESTFKIQGAARGNAGMLSIGTVFF